MARSGSVGWFPLLLAGLTAAVGLLAPATAGAQGAGTVGQVVGTVVAEDGRLLAGAAVSVEGTGVGGLTNASGEYRLTGVPAGTRRVSVRLIGYGEQSAEVTVRAGETASLDFRMASQALEMEGIVVVGYGTQTRATLTGAISSISGAELEAIPATNLSNTMAGKLPGVVAVNSSGEPGRDGSTIRIRGSHTLNDNSPLVVIDGVPDRAGGLERLQAEDIESLTVLKDASAAIYGSRAANGVILITTRRGRQGEPRLSVTLNQGYTQPTRIPEMANAVTYMSMLNEIDLYQGRPPRFSEAEIAARAAPGADPWLYPDTDWFRETLKSHSSLTRGTASLRGGSERIGYYLSLGGRTEDGFYRNSGTRYRQYDFRSNLDGQVSDAVRVRFDLSGRLEDRLYPSRDSGAIFRSIMRGKPHLPAYWPNGLPGPDIEYGDNPVVISTPETGYNRDERYYLQSNLGLDVTVPGIDGLTVRGTASFDQLFRYQKGWRTPWTLYTWDGQSRDAAGEPILQAGSRGYTAPELSQADHRAEDILLNLVGEYRRRLGEHSLGLLAGTERQMGDRSSLTAFRRYFPTDQIDEIFAGGDADKDNGGTAGLSRRQNYFGRVNYDYDSRYLLELVGRYDGSYIFAEDGRYGFFPSFSAGWRISEEGFFQGLRPVVDDLKLRASWGRTGNDRIAEWQYLATFGFGDGYVFGLDQEVQSLRQTRIPNPDVTWEVAEQFDVGVDAVLVDNRLALTFDYFRNRRKDILWQRNASVPQTAGLSLPPENIGEVDSWGYDGALTWRQPVARETSVDVTLTGGYAQNRIRFWDEAPGAPDWQRSTGSRMATGLYYRAIGIFRDEAHVQSYPHWAGARPGDVIFEDLNGDGQITAEDRFRMDRNADPTFTYGVSLGLSMRGFEVSALLQGARGAVQYISTESGENGNYFDLYARDRWTPDNPDASQPRAHTGGEYWRSNANTHFLVNADYLRLRSLEVAYAVPSRLATRLGAEALRLYVSGFNLLTWDDFKFMDPEARNSGGQYYPQSRVLNVGTSFSF